MKKLSQWVKYKINYAGTKHELALEPYIATLGVPYRFQYPAGHYFLDFALPHQQVALEVDGDSHLRAAQKAKDTEKTAWLEARGWKVVRCKNSQVAKDPLGALNTMMEEAGLPFRATQPKE